MKKRDIVIIATVSGIAVIALLIGLVSCNKSDAPDVSSFSTANPSDFISENCAKRSNGIDEHESSKNARYNFVFDTHCRLYLAS